MALTHSAKQSGYVFLGTLSSRILGFIRVILLATTLGFTRVSDSYLIANNTPNMMFELILGSVIASTMVPFFVQQHKKKDLKADDALTTFAILTALVLTVVALLFAPLLARLMTIMNTDSSASAQNELVLFFLLFFLPQIFFYAVTATMQAYLSARKRFIAAAFAPIANNIIVISTLLYLKTRSEELTAPLETIQNQNATWILAISTTLGVVSVTTIVTIAYLRAGGRLRFASIRHKNVRLLLTRSKWMVAYACANQLTLFVVIALANSSEGGVLMYTTAFLFSQLLHGLLAVTIMTTMIPRIAHTIETAEDSYEEIEVTSDTIKLSKSTATGLVVIMAVVSALLIAVAIPALILLTAYGQVSSSQAQMTGRVLIAFTAFLPMYSLYLFVVRLGNAFNETKKLFIINVIQNVLNIVLAIVFINEFGIVGLALSFSLSYLIVIPLSLKLVSKITSTSLLDRKVVSIMFLFCGLGAVAGFTASSGISGVIPSILSGLVVCALLQLIGAFLVKDELKILGELVYKKSKSPRNLEI